MHFTHGSHNYLVHFGYILYVVIKRAAFGDGLLVLWFNDGGYFVVWRVLILHYIGIVQ